MNDIDPTILSDQEIAAEISLIGTRWKLLWSEQHNRQEEKRQQANAAADTFIQECRRPRANNGSATFRRRV